MKILIAYYSWSGNTRRIAKIIHELVDGDIIEIIPEKPYPKSYWETVEQARKEIRTGYKPPIKTRVENIEDYDIVFLGSPNWWGTLAPPVVSFIELHNLSNKTIAPFFTHGGGGIQRMLSDLRKLCPNARILQPLVVYEDGGEDLVERVRNWIKSLKIIEI